MKSLLDTHTLLWFYLDDPRLSARAMALILDPANVKIVSPASYWEVAIKVNIGKYALEVPYDEFIQEAIHDNGFEILPIEPRHTSAVVALPRHHNDPFDRLLIAQAMVENISILSVDAVLDQYAVQRLW